MTSPVFVVLLALGGLISGALEADQKINITSPKTNTRKGIEMNVFNENTKRENNLINMRTNINNNIDKHTDLNRKFKDYYQNYRIFDNIIKNKEQRSQSTYKLYSDSFVRNKRDNSTFRNFGNSRNKYSRYNNLPRSRQKREDPGLCYKFRVSEDTKQIQHPHSSSNENYFSNAYCTHTIKGEEGQQIKLTFVDMFHIEYHPQCAYDFLEIRDGLHGYANLLAKVCGDAFPNTITSTGPHLWLKFSSDDTIEYEGFHINVEYIESSTSHSIPESCFKIIEGQTHGVIDKTTIDSACETQTGNHDLDVLWNITTAENTKIYLNFTSYSPEMPNECHDNLIQVFGEVLEYDANLARYCGSVANAVTSKTNRMYVRMFASTNAKKTNFNATFTAFRTLDPTKDEKCDDDTEFSCEDNTCIDRALKCDNYANCRLKADEDYENCKGETESTISQPHILVILVIFSLILSGMSFVFLFKCVRKLYQDHKIIKEHIRQSCEDRLDNLLESRLTLDAKRLQLDNEPRASLERDNQTNEMYKKRRQFSQHKPTSIDSDYIQETQLDLDDEPWHRDVDSVPVEDIRIEPNGRRKSEISRKEESLRTRKDESLRSRKDESQKSRKNSDMKENSLKEKREIRDASVGAPDTKESGCQTRESLFQASAETAPSSNGSGSNSRGFSTFGYSGATLARPSPPAPPIKTSEITIELLTKVPRQDSTKSQKKIHERRPMSTETTRSAPDVIIVSKPVR